MKRLLSALLLLVAANASAAEKSVSIQRDFGTLYGTLLTPAEGAETVAIIIAGSGPTDRNGNSTMGPATNMYLYLAQELEKAGIASLRYDKRAIGSSRFDDPGKIPDAVLEDFIGDAAAWAEYLAGEGFRRIVLIGHSEGALIALCAAQQTDKATAVISIAGAGYPIDQILQLQLAGQLAPAQMELLLEANQIIATLKRGEQVNMDYHSPHLRALFNPGVQPFLISWFRYDPRSEIRKLTIPVLIVNGDNDVQVPADNAEQLAKAQPRAKKAIIGGMTHVLKKCEDRTLTGQAQSVYKDTAQELDPDLVSVVTEFIGTL